QLGGGEVGGAVERQQVVLGADHPVLPRAGLQPAALVRPQGVGDGGVGAVDHRGVQPGGDVVGLLARVAGPGGGVRVELGAVEGDDLGAGAARVEVRVAGGHGDVGGLRLGARGVGRQVQVVVDELAPGVDPVGQEAAVGQVAVGGVGGQRG